MKRLEHMYWFITVVAIFSTAMGAFTLGVSDGNVIDRVIILVQLLLAGICWGTAMMHAVLTTKGWGPFA